MLEIIKSNEILDKLKLTNKDGEIKIIFPRKKTKKIMKYKNKDGTEGRSIFYQFAFPEELKESLGILEYLYFIRDGDGNIFISGTPGEAADVHKIKYGRQILLPKRFFNNIDDAGEVILCFDVVAGVLNVVLN